MRDFTILTPVPHKDLLKGAWLRSEIASCWTFLRGDDPSEADGMLILGAPSDAHDEIRGAMSIREPWQSCDE
jgi:hypothetical protein